MPALGSIFDLGGKFGTANQPSLALFLMQFLQPFMKWNWMAKTAGVGAH